MEDFEFEQLVNENRQRAEEHKENCVEGDTTQKYKKRRVKSILSGILNCLCLLCIGVAFFAFSICDLMVIELGVVLLIGFVGAACFRAGALWEKVRA